MKKVAALTVVMLLLAVLPVAAQTKSITIGNFEYLGTFLLDDGTVQSYYEMNLDASGISVDPIPFRNVIILVKGTRSGLHSDPIDFPIITTGPGCGSPGFTVPCGVLFSGQKGAALTTCATYDPVTQVFTENCVSIALQFVSLTRKNFSFALVNGEQFCTYGITTIFLEANPDERALNPHTVGHNLQVPVVLQAAPAGSCN